SDLKEVLERSFANQPLTYTIDNKIIIVKRKPIVYNQSESLLQSEINGTITDSASGQPLAGVTVQLKDGSNGTVTEQDGAFTLEVPDDAILVVSYLGYVSKEISVNGRTELSISLSPAT